MINIIFCKIFFMKHFYFIISFCVFYTFSIAQTTETFTTSGTFTVPAGVTEITVEAWGGGGRGGSRTSGNNQSYGGGGGGAYSSETTTVTSGQTITVVVGAGSNSISSGGVSSASLGGAIFVSAVGGSSVPDNSTNGASGGLASAGVGTVRFSGGNGANANGSNGGGGGSSAGISANGNNATNFNGATAPTGGGNGGNGTVGAGNGSTGISPGGGGGGARREGGTGGVGGSGANGLVRITYTATPTNPKTDVIEFVANYRERPELPSLYTNGSDVYSLNMGTDNDLRLDAIKIDDKNGGTFNVAIDKLADRIDIKRVDNDFTTGNRHILFFEQASSYAGSTKDFKGNYFATMEEALLCSCVNRGADNMFANSNVTNTNNIERIDYIFENGIVVPDNPNELGFPILERGGNDAFKFAPITALDANLEPSAYKAVYSYAASDWESTGFSITTSVLSGFTEAPDNEDLLETATTGSQSIAVIFVSLADLGFLPGEIIYGYSLGGADATTDPAAFVNFTNATNFPTDTAGGSGTGGLDLLSGGALSRKAFIHVPGEWYDNENPNTITTDCNDRIVISGGTASITSDKIIGSLSANDGSLTFPNNSTLDVCGDLEVIFNFDISGGNIRFSGTTPQNIIGRGEVSFDNIELTNSTGLNIDAPTSINNNLKITNGTLTANNTVTFRCGFDVQGGLNIKSRTAQIDEVLGSVVGNNNFVTEQCYPGRRAFRLVSPSTTTTTSSVSSIRENWQEDASSWDDNPNPGYGTHITGLGVQNVVPTDDGLNGFDWQPSGNPSLFVLSNTHTGTWVPINNTDLNTLSAGVPYRIMIRGSRAVDLESNQSATTNTILRERGNLAVGDVDFTFSGLAEDTPILIGNPYQANVNLQSLLANSTGVKTNEVAIWYPRLGGADNTNNTSDPNQIGGRGGYVVFNPQDVPGSTVSAPTGIDGASQVTNLLQPMQSVYLLADGSASTEIRFTEAQKFVNGDQTQGFSTNDNFKLSLLLFDAVSFDQGDTMKDGLVINFTENGQNELNGNDLNKFTNTDENLARLHVSSSTLISVEDRYLPQDNEELPLFINRYRTEEYVFVAVLENLPNQTLAYLKDAHTGEMHQLSEGENSISFSVDAIIPSSLANNRFSIVFELETLGAINFEVAGISVYPNPVEEVLNISFNQTVNADADVQIIDLLGKVAYSKSHEVDALGKLQINALKLAQGAYVLKVERADGKLYTHKILKK